MKISGQTEPEDEMDELTPIPFGQHKGTPLGDLPSDYVDWLLENIDDGPVLRALRRIYE